MRPGRHGGGRSALAAPVVAAASVLAAVSVLGPGPALPALAQHAPEAPATPEPRETPEAPGTPGRPAHRHGGATSPDAPSSERDAWQKPDAVLALLGRLDGLTVMDLGAGRGYFTFRLADAGARVIAADIDAGSLAAIEAARAERGLAPARVETRQVPEDAPALKPAEADLVLIVNTYHHIEARPAYFAKVREGLKPGGRLVVVDFFRRELPVGPPVAMKVTEDDVVKELRQAGFARFEVDRETLPHQYIVTARP